MKAPLPQTGLFIAQNIFIFSSIAIYLKYQDPINNKVLYLPILNFEFVNF
jgi:hypothetical protein